jgi:hypothetical protein
MNTMTVDPMIAKDDPPATISKIGFDCTIPWGKKWVQSDFQRSAPFELGDPPAGVSREQGPAEGHSCLPGAHDAFLRCRSRVRGVELWCTEPLSFARVGAGDRTVEVADGSRTREGSV